MLNLHGHAARLTSSGQGLRRGVQRVPLACLLLLAMPSQGGVALDAPGAGGVVYELTPRKSIGSEISGGQSQTFKISLLRGQRLRATLLKGDMRVAATALGPEGRTLGEYVSAGYEPLRISLIAEADGEHRLEVRSLEAETTTRDFSVLAEEVTIATPSDLSDNQAAHLFSEAERLRNSWSENNIRQAVGSYEQAYALWRGSKHYSEAAQALTGAGECNFTLGDYKEAVALFEKALAESRAARDWRGEGRALNNVGRVLSYTGDELKVIDYAERALSRARRLGSRAETEDRRMEAQALSNMGEAYYTLGRLSQALELFRQARAIWTEAGDRAGQALSLLNEGYVLIDSGELQAAAESHRQSLALWRMLGHRRGEALSLTAIGGIHSSFNERRLALDFHTQAKGLFESIGDRQGLVVVLNHIARAHEQLNDFQTALDHYTQALKISRDLKSRDAESLSLLYIGRLYRSMGKIVEALDYCNQSREMSRQMHKLRLEAYALIEIAAIHQYYGRMSQALTIYENLLRLYARIGDRRGRVKTLSQMGSLYYANEKREEALAYFRSALPLSEATKDRSEEILIHYNIARVARDLKRTDEALSHAESSVRLSESARVQIAGYGFRSSYFAAARKYYELYIDLLMKADKERPGEGSAARALHISESAHARSLLDLFAETSVNIRQGVDSALLERERSLQQALSGKARYLTMLLGSSPLQSESTRSVEEEVDRLTREYHEVQEQIRIRSPRYATLTQPQPLKLEEIQRELRADTLLLEYILGTEKSFLWAITANSFVAYELPGRAQIERVAEDVYKLLSTRPPESGASETNRQYARLTATLSAMLLGKVADQLAGKRLLIVPDGKLNYIPFEALPLPGPIDSAPAEEVVPLVTQHEVAYLPSASLLTVIRREAAQRGRAGKTVMVLADPVFDADDPRMPRGVVATRPATEAVGAQGRIETSKLPRLHFTREEVDAILSVTPRGQGALAAGFDANRSTALGEQLQQFQIVHFSTHALVNREHPEMSSIVLSMVNKQGEPENGLLQLHDIYNLKLSAELVVLSACDTGLGKDIGGEGLVGLTRGFMYAGARNVMASLWQVDDAATAELMKHFYREMLVKGSPPTAALRAAKIAVWQQKRRSAPYFWSSFVLQGEPDVVVVVGPEEKRVSTLTLALVLAALAAGAYAFRRFRRRGRQP